MASEPPPESIIISQFTGLRNTVSEERLVPGELSAAVNVDIDDAGQMRRRRGFSRRLTGNFHSAQDISGRTFVVRDGVLGTLDTAYNFTALGPGGPDPLSYTAVGETVYFSSRSVSGKIVNGVLQPWGQSGGAGQWISPVIRPTDTLGAINGQFLAKPPLATEIESYSGRIYLGHENIMWATELYLYDLVDPDKNYIQTTDEITMIRAVSDGLYVGTTAQLLFLKGTLSSGLKQSVVVDSGVIRGSAVQVPYSKAHPQAQQRPVPEGSGPMFMTEAGICLGLDNGEVYNITQDRVVFPGAARAAVLCRSDQGATSYVASVDSAGGPSANTRIGDHVDAEIVRASQRS